MHITPQRLALVLAAGWLLAPPTAPAQVKPIQDNGAAEGLSPDVVNFEPEYRGRAAKQAGMAVPAAPGTPPSPPDPHDLRGIWVVGKTFPISTAPGGGGPPPPGGPGSPPADSGPQPQFNGVYGVGRRHVPESVCVPRSAFTMGLPGKIIQTDQVIYILRNGQDGTSYRRIVLGGTLPTDVKPSHAGYSVGHWDGDTLVVQTTGLKGEMSAGDFTTALGLPYSRDTRVTERFRKIEGNLKLEDVITFEDPRLKAPYSARIVSYWRPDLKFVEAPCEDYSDPLETETTGPFAGGDEPQRRLPPTVGPAAPKAQP